MKLFNKKNNRGFTLIELLVVISIIGILSSVVLASLTSAKDKAKIARYQSDLHQAELFLELYQAEYGGYPAGDPTKYYCIADSSILTQCMIGGSTTGILNITSAGGGNTITALLNNTLNGVDNLALVSAPKLKNDITLGNNSYRGILYRPCSSPTTVGGISVCVVTDPSTTVGNPVLIYPTSAAGSVPVKAKVVGTNTVSDLQVP